MHTFVTIEDQQEVLNVLSIVPTSMTLDDFKGLLCSPFDLSWRYLPFILLTYFNRWRQWQQQQQEHIKKVLRTTEMNGCLSKFLVSETNWIRFFY